MILLKRRVDGWVVAGFYQRPECQAERDILYHTPEVLAVSNHLLDSVILRLGLNLDVRSLE